jgi:recombination protein RecA
MKVKIVKNKVAPPFRVAEFDMLGECGICYSGDVLDLAVTDRIVERSGSWFSYGETRLGQGRDNARKFLEEQPDMLEEIRQKVLTARGFGVESEEPAEAEIEADAIADE